VKLHKLFGSNDIIWILTGCSVYRVVLH